MTADTTPAPSGQDHPAPRRFDLGGVACSTHTIPQFLAELKVLLAGKSLQPRTALFVNAHVYNLAMQNSVLRQHLNGARIVTADGMAIVWAARLFGVRMSERCNMTESFRAFLVASDMPHSTALLIGCSGPEAESAGASVGHFSDHCQVRQAFSGFLTNQEYRDIFQRNPDVDFILLGMGTPRSEELAQLASELCPRSIVWAIGGGTIRILAGTMREAPTPWRRLGLQWLHRLGSEPRQLWRRYLFGNPAFALRIARAAWLSGRGS